MRCLATDVTTRPGRLAGKVALVTGAGSGIARESALLFAREGASVVVADINDANGNETVKAVTAAGGEAFFQKVDISREADVEALVKSCVTRYGTLDVAFNCAAIWLAKDGPVAELDAQVWNAVLNVNLTGAFLCCKHELAIMMKNKQGSIINVSSISGVASSDRMAYAAAKSGILALTRSIAVKYAPIRANVIAPGQVDTPMLDDVFADPARKQAYAGMTPAGRFAQPVEVAYLALYLATDESKFLTGAVVPIDGGYLAR
jgi:NAD(P)-dependent dehydrogenase (short-subunit alcohol dehydrogenase family)